MGIYINPKGMTKEEFLLNYALRVGKADFMYAPCDPDGRIPVVYVSNGTFGAAAIAYNDREKQEFLRPNDLRPKVFCIVRSTDLARHDPNALESLRQALKEG